MTKKNCDLLVAADASSSSGKARKARDYGIPVVSVAAFVEQLGSPSQATGRDGHDENADDERADES